MPVDKKLQKKPDAKSDAQKDSVAKAKGTRTFASTWTHDPELSACENMENRCIAKGHCIP